MKKLPVDVGELALYMEDSNPEHGQYLDTETGEIIVVENWLADTWEEGDGTLEGFDGYKRLEDWQKRAVEVLLAFEEHPSDRYRKVPSLSSGEQYVLMEWFAGTVSDPSLRKRLELALSGRGAFKRFKEVLSRYPGEQKRWYGYKQQRVEKQARAWLASIEIEPE
ncbi:MAG: UPF0158 family protein [Candidatus Odinarchaeota archaeon]